VSLSLCSGLRIATSPSEFVNRLHLVSGKYAPIMWSFKLINFKIVNNCYVKFKNTKVTLFVIGQSVADFCFNLFQSQGRPRRAYGGQISNGRGLSPEYIGLPLSALFQKCSERVFYSSTIGAIYENDSKEKAKRKHKRIILWKM
jgi:hypothetical protein